MLKKLLLTFTTLILVGFSWLIASDYKTSYVISKSSIIFSHTFHVEEQEISCVDCHIEIESSQMSSDRNLPSMDECAACHDIEDDELCGSCHVDPDEPEVQTDYERSIIFNHSIHIEQGVDCNLCHGNVGSVVKLTDANYPRMRLCMDCHNSVKASDRCELCHASRISLTDIHPAGWRHNHGLEASFDQEYCNDCHRDRTSCIACHSGDNLSGNIHDLNFRHTHGLDAKGKIADCQTCHDSENFCNDCHFRENRMPIEHSTLAWLTSHKRAALDDPENCAVCHGQADPTCGRSGCHLDLDGALGNDPVIHDRDAGRFDSEGEWHNDRSYFCFNCHQSTASAGVGFCGYCHGVED